MYAIRSYYVDADENLLKENIPAEKIFMLGNLMIDTLVPGAKWPMAPLSCAKGARRNATGAAKSPVFASTAEPFPLAVPATAMKTCAKAVITSYSIHYTKLYE